MVLNLVLVFIFCCATAFAKVPISQCDILDPNFNECYKEFLSDDLLYTLVQEGIPELNISRLNTLYIPTKNITTDSPLAKGYLRADAYISAVDDGKVEKFKATADGFPFIKFKLVIGNAYLMMNGSYETQLLVNDYNITGFGEYSMLLENVTTVIHGSGLIQRGEDSLAFLTLQKVSVSSTGENATNIIVDGLLPNDKPLAAKVVEVLNSYSVDFVQEVYPAFKPTVNDIIWKDLEKYFSKVPISNHSPVH